MASEQNPPKEGTDRMATAHKPRGDEHRELDVEVDAFVKKVDSAIQEARGRMSDEELKRADEEARAILNRASVAAKFSRHRE
jgi:hypothetical protein